MTFYIHCIQVGRNDNFCITHAHVWREGVNGCVYFGGDAVWMWDQNPYRNHHTGFCWAQALFGGLNGPHKEAFLRGEEFSVVETDSDYAHVAHVTDLCEFGPDVPEGF